MALIGLGYATVSTIVFLLGAVVGGVHSRLRFASVALIRDILEGLVAVVKVGMLLFLRIFLLPMILGTSFIYVHSVEYYILHALLQYFYLLRVVYFRIFPCSICHTSSSYHIIGEYENSQICVLLQAD